MHGEFMHLVPKELRKNLNFRKQVYELGYKDAGYAREIQEMCSIDPLFYINTFGVTYDPRITECPARPFITYEFQDELIFEINQAIDLGKSEDLLVEKSRDMGVSWDCLFALEHRWHFRPLQSFLLGSRTEDYVDRTGNAKSLFWKIDFMHKYQPRWLLPTGRELGGKDPNRTHMHLENADNGSVIDGEASGKNFARGDRRTAIFLDEFAADDKGSESNAASADSTPVRIFNSTPLGTGNEFYVIRQSGRAKILTYHWSLHPVKAAGLYTSRKGKVEILDRDYKFPEGYKFITDSKMRSPWYDHECQRRAAWQIAQELDINYQGAGKQFFVAAMLEEVQKQRCYPPFITGRLEFDFERDANDVEFDRDKNGEVELWCYLDLKDKPDRNFNYSIGCDIATGTGGTLSTNSVASVVNCLTGEQVAEFATKHMIPNEFAEHAVALCKFFHNALLTWEANGPGAEFGKKVHELGYSNIYYRKNSDTSRKMGNRDIPGWWSTKDKKRELLGFFSDEMSKGRYTPRSGHVIEEAKGYVFDKGKIVHSHSKTSASPDDSEVGDNHGDRVVAAALSVLGRRERPKIPEASALNGKYSKIPPNCMAARLQLYEEEEMQKLEEAW